MPESAAYDPNRDFVYVSNVNHYAKDNNGFISRVNADGSSLQLKWLTGLHSPTGLTVSGDRLFAVDFDALVIIDLNKEKIIARVDAEDAQDNPVLNDVAVSKAGDIYVSGSRSRNIYKMTDGKLKIWLHDAERLEKANGLFVHKDVVFHGGEVWTAFEINSKKPSPSFTSMGKGLIDIDGISLDGKGGFLVTLIDDTRLWSVQHGHQPIPLTQSPVNGIDMEYVPGKNLLFIPRVGNTLSAYRLEN